MIVVTGGAGFIGSALLWKLNQLGLKDILVVDNLASSQKWCNLVKRSYLDYTHRDRFISGIRNREFKGRISSIVHLGACSSTTEDNADFLMANNFHYSRDLCRFAMDEGIRFINASSAATYGGGECGFDDDHTRLESLRPLNMYGYSKHLFDLWLKKQGFPENVASLKFFNVYGPNEYHKGEMQSVASKLYKEIRQTGQASLFAANRDDIADGEQKRDFIYIKDVADIVAWLLLERPDLGGIRNIGTGMARSFNDVAKSVFAALDKPVNIKYIPTPEAISRNYQNFTEARMDWLKESGYKKPLTALENGIKDYVNGYLDCEDPYL